MGLEGGLLVEKPTNKMSLATIGAYMHVDVHKNHGLRIKHLRVSKVKREDTKFTALKSGTGNGEEAEERSQN